jgi:hypothetical protein
VTALELVRHEPDWLGALAIALARPPGLPERRSGEDPWSRGRTDRPRRISDDLAWFRDAMDDPGEYGLTAVPDIAAVGVWEPRADLAVRLERLDARGVLTAAGFFLHRDAPAG